MFINSFKTNDESTKVIPEDKLKNFKGFVRERMLGMEFVSYEESYSVARIVLRNTSPIQLSAYCNDKTVKAIGSALDNSNVTIHLDGEKYILEITRKDAVTLRLGDGLKYLATIPKKTASIDMYIGQTSQNCPCIMSLSNVVPHALVAGNTGSGKSIAIHDMLLSMASRYDADEINVYAIDPKNETFKGYFGNETSIFKKSVSSKGDAYALLEELEEEFVNRQKMFAELDTYCNGIEDYNNMMPKEKRLPLIVLIVEEIDALLTGTSGYEGEMAKKIKSVLTAFSKEYRSQGLRLILISQRPNGKVVGTDLRDQCAVRLALKLEKEASRMVLGNTNATRLGMGGDAFLSISDGHEDVRLKTAMVDRDEILKAQEYIKKGI